LPDGLSGIFFRAALDRANHLDAAEEFSLNAHAFGSWKTAPLLAHEIEIGDDRVMRMTPIAHPGRLLKRELLARNLSANRIGLDIGVPSGRITDILNGRRAITADTAVRLGRYFGNSAQFWLDLQGQYDIGLVERQKGAEIARRVRPADAA
jgi:addiction module HigA family antidote